MGFLASMYIWEVVGCVCARVRTCMLGWGPPPPLPPPPQVESMFTLTMSTYIMLNIFQCLQEPVFATSVNNATVRVFANNHLLMVDKHKINCNDDWNSTTLSVKKNSRKQTNNRWLSHHSISDIARQVNCILGKENVFKTCQFWILTSFSWKSGKQTTV